MTSVFADACSWVLGAVSYSLIFWGEHSRSANSVGRGTIVGRSAQFAQLKEDPKNVCVGRDRERERDKEK